MRAAAGLLLAVMTSAEGDRRGLRIGMPEYEPMRNMFSAFSSPDMADIGRYRHALASLKKLLVDSYYTEDEARLLLQLTEFVGFNPDRLSSVAEKQEHDRKLPSRGEDGQADLFRLFLIDTGLSVDMARFLLDDEEDDDTEDDTKTKLGVYDALVELGMLFEWNGMTRSLVQIAPVAEDLHLVADYFQTVKLQYNTDADDFEPVMYIGLDSRALVAAAPRSHSKEGATTVLDLCCGSGVQGITAARYHANKLVSVDLNPRAIRFTRFNAVFNGFAYYSSSDEEEDNVDVEVSVIHGTLYWAMDSELNLPHLRGKYLGGVEKAVVLSASKAKGLLEDDGNSADDVEWQVPRPGKYDVILANPPYLPLAYDAGNMFGAGGATGEDITRQIIAGSPFYLRPTGSLHLVANLMNVADYEAKLRKWWALGIDAVDATAAAPDDRRRKGSSEEAMKADGNKQCTAESDEDGGCVDNDSDDAVKIGINNSTEQAAKLMGEAAGSGFCIMQVYHGAVWTRARYAKLVEGEAGGNKVEQYEAQLAAHGIDGVTTGFVYLFRDPVLTQHHYGSEKVHDFIWQVASGRGEYAPSTLARTRRVLSSNDYGYAAP